jgi:hypothetical protein
MTNTHVSEAKTVPTHGRTIAFEYCLPVIVSIVILTVIPETHSEPLVRVINTAAVSPGLSAVFVNVQVGVALNAAPCAPLYNTCEESSVTFKFPVLFSSKLIAKVVPPDSTDAPANSNFSMGVGLGVGVGAALGIGVGVELGLGLGLVGDEDCIKP